MFDELSKMCENITEEIPVIPTEDEAKAFIRAHAKKIVDTCLEGWLDGLTEVWRDNLKCRCGRRLYDCKAFDGDSQHGDRY